MGIPGFDCREVSICLYPALASRGFRPARYALTAGHWPSVTWRWKASISLAKGSAFGASAFTSFGGWGAHALRMADGRRSKDSCRSFSRRGVSLGGPAGGGATPSATETRRRGSARRIERRMGLSLGERWLVSDFTVDVADSG